MLRKNERKKQAANAVAFGYDLETSIYYNLIIKQETKLSKT
jgi:hypothetical protein